MSRRRWRTPPFGCPARHVTKRTISVPAVSTCMRPTVTDATKVGGSGLSPRLRLDASRSAWRRHGDRRTRQAPALSEPEAANIAHLATVERSLLFGIDSHSYGRAVFRPNPNGGTYCVPNAV